MCFFAVSFLLLGSQHCWFEVFIDSGEHSAENYHVVNNLQGISVLEIERVYVFSPSNWGRSLEDEKDREN